MWSTSRAARRFRPTARTSSVMPCGGATGAFRSWRSGACGGANNRAYYGIYHAISAVHALDGNAYKRHKDALANFNKNYVKPEIFPRKLGKKIVESEEIRHASDYDDFYIATREEAEEQIQTAKELVSRVEEYVQARWKKESEKTVRNAEYLDMIDRGIAQLSAGNGQEHELNETD